MLHDRKLWLLIAAFFVLHGLIAAFLPLVEDEAYYELWSRYPAFGYFDHPPMIAWWIAAGEWLLGPTTLGARIGPLIANALVTLMTWRIAWVFSGNRRAAFLAALFQKAMPAFATFGFAATPDAPLVLFWVAATWALVEALNGGRGVWWLAVGLFAGLSVLAKFTGFFLGLALVIWLLASREGRARLRRPEVWAGAAIGVLVLVPFLLWNLQHDWIGFQRQFGRVGREGGVSLLGLAPFLFAVVLLASPLILWEGGRALLSRRVPPVLVWLAAPVVLFLIWHALTSRAGAQWLGPVYPSLAVMAALVAARGRWVRGFAAPVGFALGALALVLAFWPWRPLFLGHSPATQVRGWFGTVAAIRDLAAASGARWIATDGYGLTAQLDHYLRPDGPEVRQVSEPWRYLFLPPLAVGRCDETALFVSRADHEGAVAYFLQSEPGPDILRRQAGITLMRYHTAIVRGLRDCPGSQP